MSGPMTEAESGAIYCRYWGHDSRHDGGAHAVAIVQHRRDQVELGDLRKMLREARAMIERKSER